MKYAICMIQNDGNGRDIVNLVPQDVQALVLLFNADQTNVTRKFFLNYYSHKYYLKGVKKNLSFLYSFFNANENTMYFKN